MQRAVMKNGVWGVVEGYDTRPIIPTSPDAPTTTEDKLWQNRMEKELREWWLRDDKAAGILIEIIEEDQEHHIENYKCAKDIWDHLKKVHEESHTGIPTFYTKIGILEKKYEDGESMQMHIDFLLRENNKLAAAGKAFNNEFMAQILLMSLPHPSLWETITVTLLQSTSNPKKLSMHDVSACLLQEAAHLTGSASTATSDSALLTKDRIRQRGKSRRTRSNPNASTASTLGTLKTNVRERRLTRQKGRRRRMAKLRLMQQRPPATLNQSMKIWLPFALSPMPTPCMMMILMYLLLQTYQTSRRPWQMTPS
jgi:gag-polypeptide of LTR copia-type